MDKISEENCNTSVRDGVCRADVSPADVWSRKKKICKLGTAGHKKIMTPHAQPLTNSQSADAVGLGLVGASHKGWWELD